MNTKTKLVIGTSIFLLTLVFSLPVLAKSYSSTTVGALKVKSATIKKDTLFVKKNLNTIYNVFVKPKKEVIAEEVLPQIGCGNKIIESNEQCDDGNENDQDGCARCEICAGPGLQNYIYGGPYNKCCPNLFLQGGVCNAVYQN